MLAAGLLVFTGCGGDDAAGEATTVETSSDPAPSSPPLTSVEFPERFDAKQIVVSPAGRDGLRIREVIDQDFGSAAQHGYEQLIDNDFGEPTDVTASSPDAPADASVVEVEGDRTRIRIGDPNVTISGQHRYVLSYTLPDANSSRALALDIIGNDDELETGTLEIVVAGLELRDPVCSVGDSAAVSGCTLIADGGVYRAVLSPVAPGRGVTIAADVVGRTRPDEVPEPTLPPRR